MSRRKFTRRTRRIAIVLGLAALAVPATAPAYPAPAGPGGVQTTSRFPALDAHQAQIIQNNQAATRGVLKSGGPRIHMSAGQAKPDRPVQTASVTQRDSGFSWTDSLIGAGVTAGLLLLAAGGALVVQRRGRLGYR
jgi:hypothetical protein